MTDIVPAQSAEIRRLVSSGQISLAELLERLAPPVEPPVVTKDVQPKQVVLSPADKTILRTLPKALAELELPSQPRLLTEAEVAAWVPLFDRVKVAKAAVTKAEDALKDAFHSHLDLSTEGPLGKNGHKLSEGEVVAPEYDKKVVRGLVGGNAVQLTDADLQELEAAGEIDHATYLRMTKVIPAKREPVADAIMAEINKNPALLDVIAKKATRTEQTTAIRMAKN